MKNTTITLLFAGWMMLICSTAVYSQSATGSQPGKLEFIKFEWSNVVDDFSINPISYLQDSRGFMWIASYTGVALFDGYNFKIFRQNEYNPSSSRITGLAEDMEGNIWLIGLRNSRIVIDVLNPKTEVVVPLHRFLGQEQPIEIPVKDDVVVLHNTGGKIWVGSTDAGYLYDGKWQQIFNPVQHRRICDSWWPANGGFWTIYSDKNAIFLENSSGEILDSVPQKRYIWLDEHLDLWSAPVEGKPIYRQLTARAGKVNIQQYSQLPQFQWISELLTTTDYRSPLRFGYDWNIPELVLSRTNGSGSINLTREFPEVSPKGEFYFDRQGGIWTFSQNRIVRLIEKHPGGFQTCLTDESLDRSIRGMIQIGNQLYVNSYKGDCRINLDNMAVSKFNIIGGQGLSFLPEKNGFWAGGHGGLLFYIEPGKPGIPIPFERRSDINVFLRCQSGILAGTANGLFKINTEKGISEPLPLQHLGIDYLYKNRKGIWACTTDGLYLTDEYGKTLAHYLPPGENLPFSRMTHLHEDANGDFWIATRGSGLIQWSQEKGIIRHLTESEGLSNNDIHAVYADVSESLWLPSNYGLMRLHKESGRIETFFKRDGIADSEFNTLSHYQAIDGRLFFGGVNGITAFYPKDIPSQDERTPKLQLTEARTFQIKSGDFINHLPEANAGKPIIITPNDDYIDIRVSPLVFEDINQIKYSWKIEGYGDKWILQKSPLIRLHNMPYGQHRLHIRYTMRGNTWSENELIIPIEVERPFYLSWPFLLLMIICLFTASWAVGNWRAKQLRDANLKLEQEVKNRTRQIETDKAVIEQQALELRSLDEVKSRFFANITHELRTPLTLILGPVEKAIQHIHQPQKATEYMQMIQRNASKLLNLVEEILDLSKMEANKITVVEEPTRLYHFVSRLVASFAPYAEHRGVGLNLVFNCPRYTVIMMDGPKWEKIINNLINNALKFTPGNGIIVVTTDIINNELVISVTDTGSGIHPDDLPFIFDRYYQARAEGAPMQGGAGIGLSLCREYARLFGGEISAQSEPGRGSTFTIRQPLASIETMEAPETSLLRKEATGKTAISVPTSPTANRRTILIAEDDGDMSEYVQSILEPQYNLLIANNGKAALEIIEKSSPDLVLSDLMMPEMDGLQLLQTIREQSLDIPFIMLTARADTPDRLAALTLGVDDYLSKPFQEEELTARLKNLISRYDTRKNAREKQNNMSPEESFDQKWLRHFELLVMEKMSNTEFSIDSLADELHISRRNLFYKVKACTGMSPNQYLTEVRLGKARQLLESRQFETMAEVCYAVGFRTPRYFSRLMKERFGQTL